MIQGRNLVVMDVTGAYSPHGGGFAVQKCTTHHPLLYPSLLSWKYRINFVLHLIEMRFIVRQGKSDPFITIKYGSGKEKYRSKVMYNTLSPVWNETCRLPLPDEDHKMVIVS
jgi:hypothetical protein